MNVVRAFEEQTGNFALLSCQNTFYLTSDYERLYKHEQLCKVATR